MTIITYRKKKPKFSKRKKGLKEAECEKKAQK